MMLRLIPALVALSLGSTKSPMSDEHHAAAPSRILSKYFPAVPGFRIVQGPTEYAPGNLFEYIDGGADAYLQFDFEDLQTATYLNAQRVEVTVDIYHHRDADRAYGIYSQERPAGSTPIPVGVEGHGGSDHLELVAGPFYVKLVQSGNKAESVLRLFADKVVAKLGGRRSPPAVLAAFPKAGKIPRSEKLAARNFLGHSFLHDGVAVPYQIEGARFRLFAVRGKDEADVRRMVERYRMIGKAPAAEVKPTGAETIQDPYNGEVVLRWGGRWLWGAIDQASPGKAQLVDDLGQAILRDMN
jgi:hypothetical protein